MIVLDEADALMGLGFADDLGTIFNKILKNESPGERKYQAVLCSATLTDEVGKRLFAAHKNSNHINGTLSSFSIFSFTGAETKVNGLIQTRSIEIRRR